ncbi:MAG TPA: DUF4173 domain-containing protein [Herpetosiphonaceae bacterium]
MTESIRLRFGIVGAALLLGAAGSALLQPAPWGLNLLLWIALLVAALLGLARWEGVPLVGGGRWMLAPAVGFAGAFLWRDSPTLQMLNLLCLLLALGLAAYRAQAGQLRTAGIVDYALGLAYAGLNAIVGFLLLIGDEVPWRQLAVPRRSPQTVAIIRGVLLALPLLFVFGALFASADAVFAEAVADLFDWNVESVVTDLFWLAVWAWLAGGILRFALRFDVERAESRDFAAPWTVGAIEMSVVLGLLNALFLAFVAVQLRYFFGGAALVVSSDGLTYAEYARRGFFELVTVAALVLPLLLAVHWLLDRSAPGSERRFGWLAGALVALLFVIMASAVQRMILYQQAFGLTELRLYTSAFMAWLALVFVWFGLTVLRGRRERFVFGALVAGLLTVVALNALNPDELIVRTNLARPPVNAAFDAGYAASLSADAVPALVAGLPQVDPASRCTIASALRRRWQPPAAPDWRTWNASRAAAYRAVAARGAELEGGC